MKKALLFLFLIILITCQPSKERLEEVKRKRKEHDKQLAECILKNETTSSELKKLIEENKDDHLMKALHPRDHKLDRSDREIIRNCRKALFDKRREEIEKEREKKRREANDNL